MEWVQNWEPIKTCLLERMDALKYQIRIQGQIDHSWSEWLCGFEISRLSNPEGQADTLLEGLVTDQAALRGLLNKLWDLNLTILSVQQVECRVETEK